MTCSATRIAEIDCSINWLDGCIGRPNLVQLREAFEPVFSGVHQPFQLPFNIVPGNQESTVGEANRQVCPARRRLTESRCLVMPWPLALACLLAGWSITAQAADASAPVHNVDGSFVRNGWFSAPFPPETWRLTSWPPPRRSERSTQGRQCGDPKRRDAVDRTRFRSDYDLVKSKKRLASNRGRWRMLIVNCVQIAQQKRMYGFRTVAPLGQRKKWSQVRFTRTVLEEFRREVDPTSKGASPRMLFSAGQSL